MTQPVVAIKQLNHYYGQGELRRQMLFEIDLDIHRGEFAIMTGPSGSGKSTLLSLIGCLRSVQEGSLQVLGQELNGATNSARTEVRRRFGYIFQASNLLKFLTAEQNIHMSLELQPEMPRQEMRDRTLRILEAVGLADRGHHYPDQLSGGQKQRIAIACALVTQPQLVLADEPTAALDSHSGRKTVELMHRLAKEQGSAVLMVTHDRRILDVADRIIQVEDGRLGLAYRQELSLALPGLQEEQIDAIAIKPAVVTYEPGSFVFKQGDLAEKFYVITQGKVEVIREVGGEAKVLTRLGRGDYFGEIGLLQAGTRTASIRVTDEAEAKLMVIERESFQALMGESELTNTAIAQRFQQRVLADIVSEALPDVDVQAIFQVLPEIEVIKYGPGSNIIRQGDLADKFYIIISGQVDVLDQNSQGEEVQINILDGGAYFGEIGLMEERPRTATVRVMANTTVEVIALDQATFQRLVATSDASKAEIAKVVYDRLQNSANMQ